MQLSISSCQAASLEFMHSAGVYRRHCVLAAAASCAAAPCADSPPEVRARGGFPGEDPSGCRAAPNPDAGAAADWGGASCSAPLPAPASAAWPIMLAAAGAEAGPWLGRLHPYWRTMVVACCRVVCSRAASVRSLAERARPLSEAPGMHTWAGSTRVTQFAVLRLHQHHTQQRG